MNPEHAARPYLSFGQYLKQKYGTHVHKVSVNAGFTCPNRDGSKGIGGCTFCNNATFSPVSARQPSVTEQIRVGQETVTRRVGADKFLAYFQSYTNTYDEVCRLRACYDEALAAPGVIGMSVGTRPDCVPDEVLDLLLAYQHQGKEVWLELGLQSAFDDSLDRVNRGHGWAEYEDACRRARARGLKVCTHLIVGLPGEVPEQSLISLERVLAVGTDGLKVHPLHVVKGTQLAREWKRGEYAPISQDAYVRVVADMLCRIGPQVIVHRLTGTASRELLLAPQWCMNKWPVLNAIHQTLQGGQG
jgi:radical SAM protein (TIGR01212 family)